MAHKRKRTPRRIPISKYPFTPSTYPGKRPRFSFFFTPEGIRRIKLRTLDKFFSERKLAPLNKRYAILAYGSNACPDRLAEKNLDNVLVLFGRLVGAEAVYARRTAGKGSYVPATLARKKGSRPSWITLLTAEQFAAMDESEGRPDYYELTELKRARFFVGRREVAPLYAYVNLCRGVMTQGQNAVSLRAARQKRAMSLFRSGETTEKAASACLKFTVIPDPDPPPRFSQFLKR